MLAAVGAAIVGFLGVRFRAGARWAAIVLLRRDLTRREVGGREKRRRRKHVHHEHERSEHETKRSRHGVPFQSARPEERARVTNTRPIDGQAQVLKRWAHRIAAFPACVPETTRLVVRPDPLEDLRRDALLRPHQVG